VVFLNYTTMQMTAKIVYYGPGLCGKTTNLQHIHLKTAARSRGEMVSLETETDRTLFFDLLPLDVGVIGGMKVRLQLYTVPGQVFYNATRKLVLKNVDGVVFVADSQPAMVDANLESISNLKANLAEMGLTLAQVPIVFQYNKRDLRNILPLETMNEELNPDGHPWFEAAALHGIGVFETLKAISRLAITSVRQKVGTDVSRARLAAVPTAAGSDRALDALVAEPPAAPAEAVPGEAPPPEEGRGEPAASPAAGAEAAAEPNVEFAEEDTSEYRLRPVRTRDTLDIHAELEKLRAMAAAPAPRAEPRYKSPETSAVERRLQDMIGGSGARQDVKRKATIDVPTGLLKSAGVLRLHLAFENGSGSEEVVRDAIVIRLGDNKKLERLSLHIDLEVKGKS
jgi:signal recognition particle receptor subunit beta